MRPNNEIAYQGNCAGSFSGQAMLSECWVRASAQVDCTAGAFNGTIIFQGSNDAPIGQFPGQFTPTNWNNIGSSQQIVCSISAGQSSLIPSFETCYQYHRLISVAGNNGNTVGSCTIRVKTSGL